MTTLSKGEAAKNLLNPDRVLNGSANTVTGQTASSKLAKVYSSWVNPAKVHMISNSSAKLARLVANAMLAQRISSINAIGAICEQTGANITDVEIALGSDSRIGSDYLGAGIGFGGSCFRKDILSLRYLAESLSLPAVSDYWL
jgi:UDPglucose 6-dehydrogenase